MNRRNRFLIALILLIAASAVGATEYRTTEIGRPDGPNPGSYGMDINDSGTVLCQWLKDGPNDMSGVAIWSKSAGAVDLTDLNGLQFPAGLNNSGQIAGNGSKTPPPYEVAKVRDADGTILQLGLLPGRGTSVARGINDAGMVIGSMEDWDSGNQLAVRWDSAGNTSTIAESADPVAINADGLVAYNMMSYGYPHDDGLWGPSHAYCWDGITSRSLSPLVPGGSSYASGINDAGQIVGESGNHAVLWNADGSVVDLGLGRASDINNRGQIVGYLSGYGGVVWNADLTIDYLGPEAELSAINDLGQVAGTICRDGEAPVAAMWEPVPEPASTFGLLAGLGGLAGLIVRRRHR